MALTGHVPFDGGLSGLDTETGYFTFSTTDVTGELATKFSTIYGATFVLVGNIAAGSAQTISINETFTNGAHTVSGGTITVQRALETGGSATSGLGVLYTLYGKS